MSQGQVVWRSGQDEHWRIRGEREDMLWGVSAFKLTARSQGDQRRWVDRIQGIFNRERVVLRAFHETLWPRLPEGAVLFGSPPYDRGTWDLNELRILAARDKRVQRLTQIGMRNLRILFRLSHKTGCIFEIVIDATLKHAGGLTTNLIDHVIRQVAHDCRRLQKRFPKAAIILSARNEWSAHNQTATTAPEVNAWAERFYRWKNGPNFKISRTSPGPGWTAEQWPEGFLIVDDGGNNKLTYRCGTGPGVYQMAALHPLRRRGWQRGLDPNELRQLKRDANGAPFGWTESMYLVEREDRERAERWYRGPDGWTTDLNGYSDFLDTASQQTSYFIVHAEKLLQCDPNWPRPVTRLEGHLAERFGGRIQ
jgi:hypothetical protein